jgi:hypothetical protein
MVVNPTTRFRVDRGQEGSPATATLCRTALGPGRAGTAEDRATARRAVAQRLGDHRGAGDSTAERVAPPERVEARRSDPGREAGAVRELFALRRRAEGDDGSGRPEGRPEFGMLPDRAAAG